MNKGFIPRFPALDEGAGSQGSSRACVSFIADCKMSGFTNAVKEGVDTFFDMSIISLNRGTPSVTFDARWPACAKSILKSFEAISPRKKHRWTLHGVAQHVDCR